MRGRVVLFVSDKDTCNLPMVSTCTMELIYVRGVPIDGSIVGFPFSNFQTLALQIDHPHPPHHACHHNMYL